MNPKIAAKVPLDSSASAQIVRFAFAISLEAVLLQNNACEAGHNEIDYYQIQPLRNTDGCLMIRILATTRLSFPGAAHTTV